MTLVYEGAISSSAVGGARTHFRGMARALERLADEPVVIVLPHFRGEDRYDAGVTTAEVLGVRVPRRGVFGHIAYEVAKHGVFGRVRLRDLRKRQRTTVVLRITPVGLSPLFLRSIGVRVVLEVNGLPDDESRSRGYRGRSLALIRLSTSLQLRCANDVVAVTDGLARAVRSRSRARVLRLENAVDLADVSHLDQDAGAPHTVVYTGAFAPWQELDVLVEAFADVRRRDPQHPWRLVLVGDGEERRHVEATIAAEEVGGYVEITGWLDQKAAIERLLDGRIAVVPLRPKGDTDVCGSPLKLFECLGAGRTVVGSDIDGIVELTDYPIIVYRQGEPASLADALIRASSPAERVDVAAIRQSISWDDRCERLLRFLGLPLRADTQRSG